MASSLKPVSIRESLPSQSGHKGTEEEDEERHSDVEVCLDESFFINEDYRLQTYAIGPYVLEVFCLSSASTDYDLTGQLVWPGTTILNDYLIHNASQFENTRAIELGSGIGLTGILCSCLCNLVVMTDHNDIVLKVMERNIKLQNQRIGDYSTNIECEKLEWGDQYQLDFILNKYRKGFDFVLGADICYQQSNLSCLFATVKHLLSSTTPSKFLLAYVSRSKSLDMAIQEEASKLNLEVREIPNTRRLVDDGVYEGYMLEIS